MKSSKKVVNIHEAKTHLSRRWSACGGGRGDECEGRTSVARLVPIAAPGKRPLGLDKGKGWIADDFNAPLPEDILADFEGRD